MLKLIRIRNFAVVTEASIELGPGLNLLTGETGSGKSIFVDALSLLLGARASADVIRSGADVATVQGIFDVEGNAAALELLASAGIETPDGELILRREINDKGRSRAFANDIVVTTTLLRELRPSLVDIHGQGDQQSLLDPSSHIELLDEFAELSDVRSDVEAAYRKWNQARVERDELARSASGRLQRADVLEFQISEIERAALRAGEDEELEREKQILVNSERITEAASEAYDGLFDAEGSVLELISQVDRRLDTLCRYDDRVLPHLEQLRNAKYTLDDLAHYLRDYLQAIDFSADRLRVVDERLAEIDRLRRKYGGTVAAVMAKLEDFENERRQIDDSTARAEANAQVIADSCTAFLKAARQLSGLRIKAADRLSKAVRGELSELAMEDSRFDVAIATAGEVEEDGFRSSGIDRVEFLVATNPGDEPRALSRIASGGETSRLMLSLKTVSAPPEIPRTLVFDEIDVGIGGRVAEAIGIRLARLSRVNQVLCVTHQAQIARFADVHVRARKDTMDDRAVTVIERLDARGQVEELARMIGGTVETARRHAKELLKARELPDPTTNNRK